MDPRRFPELGLIAARRGRHLFDTARDLAASEGVPLVISSTTCVAEIKQIRGNGCFSTVVADPRLWASRYATAQQPTSLQDGLPMFSLDDWARALLTSSSATYVLTPSFHVPSTGKPKQDVLAVKWILDATDTATETQLITHIPVDAAVLGSRTVDLFIATLAQTRPRHFGFTFTSRTGAFDSADRIRGLRQLLAAYPGSHVYGLEPLIAADALAHGAGLVAVGQTRSHRRPSPPTDKSTRGALAVNWLPGLFLETILELRSPSVYADWYAATESPWCDTCNVYLDLFDANDADRAAIGRHNAHAFADLGKWILSIDEAHRAHALAARIIEAVAAHSRLTGTAGAAVVIDPSLAALCELDLRA